MVFVIRLGVSWENFSEICIRIQEFVSVIQTLMEKNAISASLDFMEPFVTRVLAW